VTLHTMLHRLWPLSFGPVYPCKHLARASHCLCNAALETRYWCPHCLKEHVKYVSDCATHCPCRKANVRAGELARPPYCATAASPRPQQRRLQQLWHGRARGLWQCSCRRACATRSLRPVSVSRSVLAKSRHRLDPPPTPLPPHIAAHLLHAAIASRVLRPLYPLRRTLQGSHFAARLVTSTLEVHGQVSGDTSAPPVLAPGPSPARSLQVHWVKLC
jgi:hypothetical protein